MIKKQVPLSRLIGKIDNDFNISESDWIPRVGAWVIDALSQMKCLPMERKKRVLEVSNRIATLPCNTNTKDIKVFDKNGCEIKELNSKNSCNCGNSNTEIGIFDANNNKHYEGYDDEHPETAITHVTVNELRVGTISSSPRNYVISGNSIELNFDTDSITIESYEVVTYFDEYYNCEVPYIYDNGILLEALAWYVMVKYLSRGSKHQVYSLSSPNPVLNPFTQWNNFRQRAERAVKIELSKGNDDGWRNFFYNSTFDPRR